MHKQFTLALLGISIATPLIQIAPGFALPQIATNPIVSKDFAIDRVVKIETRSGQGSGVIIKHVGNTYTILTAAHVVNNLYNLPVAITTPDRQQYSIAPSEVKIAPNSLDLATLTFQSDRNYTVAELGNSSNITRGERIFAAGFQVKSLRFYPGTVVAISHHDRDRGYGLAIGNAEILPGMSGGGLFNEAGNLIGINGKSVGTIDPNIDRSGNRDRVKPVSGLAIPIDTFTQIASKLNVEIDSRSERLRQRQTPATGSSQPTTADDFFITAQEKSQKGDYQNAIADYNRALSLNPQFEEIYFRRGIARSLTKDSQGAEADYTRAIALNPQHAEAYLHRGSTRNLLANWQGAKSDFDVAIALEPNLASAYVGRGVALCELKDRQSGLKDYDRAISIDPNNADAFTHRAFAYHQLGNNRSAVANYVAAAELYQKQGKDSKYMETVQKIKQLVKG
ncbi:tetratricopeptide repeat-containing serine protease family protein [Chamaesiphon sp. VAR_48_metabat_403]|uniref:tetratricopeptide repeat-containing S1 family peptidase n=1 Tax=Chamaesiphon sp. VAR_48_metabat_403 TaxID=2964700 RepID=UPI00286E300B|nr:tetratricopeptide repeat-containing serine protease family protein [Chamaesiphon sp. VAR_48_metabat_403]